MSTRRPKPTASEPVAPPETDEARAAQERAEQIAEAVAAIEGSPSPADTATPDAAAPAANDPRRALWTAWRRAAGSDAPTVNQLVQGGITRVDVDAIAGYIAVVTAEDTYRAIGIDRALVVPLVAMLTGRSDAELAALLAKGPAKLEPAAATADDAPADTAAG